MGLAEREEMSSRKITDCVPELQDRYADFKAKMQVRKIPFMLTCTARTFREQMALYAQGRQSLNEVNTLRKVAMMPLISLKENLYCVTWTMVSKHIINLEDDLATNDKARAFDIAIFKDGKAIWEIKVSVNDNDIPDYLEAAEIGESVGLIAGARWKKPDYPHFQMAG